jgi:iron transport multicopper oxidase
MLRFADAAVFFIHLDQHDTYIIEADGVEMEPFLLDTLTISIGQRYSLLVQAKAEATTNYALSIGQSEDMSVLHVSRNFS